MEIKEINCEVCNHPLDIKKENVYVAKNIKSLISGNENWDATDCPYCGCQNLLKKRFEKKQEDNMARTNFNCFIYSGKPSKSGKFVGSRKKRRKRAK